VTIIAMATLVAIIGELSIVNAEGARAETNRLEAQRSSIMAEAALQFAAAEIQQQNPAVATMQDAWAKVGDAGGTEYQVGQDSFRLEIVDASGRLNINSADEDTLKQFPLSEEQRDSLLDWRESAITSTRLQGAKDAYYNQLATPYNAKLAPFDSVEELLSVRGFTPYVLFSPIPPSTQSGAFNPSTQPLLYSLLTVDSLSADRDPSGKQKIDITKATFSQLSQLNIPNTLANAVVQAEQGFKSMTDVMNVSGMTLPAAQVLLNNTQVGSAPLSAGLINLNTALSPVLSAVPGMTPDVVAAILTRQSAGFQGVGDLTLVPGVTVPLLAKIVTKFCVSSRSFNVHVIGMAGQAQVAEEANLNLDDDGKVHITRIQPMAVSDALSQWNWSSLSTTQVAVGGGE